MPDIERPPAQAYRISMLKALYAWERSDLLWTRDVLASAESTLDRGHGIGVALYDVANPEGTRLRAGRKGRRYTLTRAHEHDPARLWLLSERETQILAMAAHGRPNKTIAYELGISHATVRVLVARAAAKVGVRSRSDLIGHYRDLIGRGNSCAATAEPLLRESFMNPSCDHAASCKMIPSV